MSGKLLLLITLPAVLLARSFRFLTARGAVWLGRSPNSLRASFSSSLPLVSGKCVDRRGEPGFGGTCRITGLSKQQAEEILDWLEVLGIRESKVQYERKKGFTVTYR